MRCRVLDSLLNRSDPSADFCMGMDPDVDIESYEMPVGDHVFNFGQHKGCTYLEVAQRFPSHLKW